MVGCFGTVSELHDSYGDDRVSLAWLSLDYFQVLGVLRGQQSLSWLVAFGQFLSFTSSTTVESLQAGCLLATCGPFSSLVSSARTAGSLLAGLSLGNL